MAVKKDADKEKKVVQIKATTGAWWKSTTDSLQDEATESPVTQKETGTKEKSGGVSTAKPSQKKPSPRRGRTPKKTDSPVEKEKSVTETQEVPVPVKKPRKRPTPRSKPSVTATSPEDNEQTQASVTDPELVEHSAEPLPAEVAVPDLEKSTKGRRQGKTAPEQKRKRGGRKAPAKKESTSKDEVIEQEPESAREVEQPVNLADTPADIETSDSKIATTPDPVEPEAAPEMEDASKVCKLLINAEEPEECRLALLENGRLESINVSTTGKAQRKNNIYKARIVAIEPSLQAAFVDYGTEKNGFLPFSEIHPEYYKEGLSDANRQLVENQQWKRLNITDVVEKGQEVLAQVVKEEVGKKGANMTTYLSLPGRCVVLMPGSDSSGISRKISGGEKRSELRDIMQSIEMPEGIGWIVRTASIDINQETLSRDVDYLLKLWGDIKKKGQALDGVGLVYEEQQSVLRFLREHFDPSIEEILVDDKTALSQVKAFVDMLPAQHKKNVKVRLHRGARPIFNQYSVEDQIESIYQPQVSLPSGGSIVIDPTEALVAIDVNSGSTSKGKNFEASIFLANMEAAEELARQLRLRDLGGLIVVDFIDMRSKKNIIAVEKKLKTSMKRDKAKVDFSRISKFGLMQISRQKLGAPIEAGNYSRCEHCKGRGTVRSVETLALYYLRRIQTGATRKPVERVECHFPLDVASYLLNNKRNELHDMEQRYEVVITVVAETDMKPADNEIIFHKTEKQQITPKQA